MSFREIYLKLAFLINIILYVRCQCNENDRHFPTPVYFVDFIAPVLINCNIWELLYWRASVFLSKIIVLYGDMINIVRKIPLDIGGVERLRQEFSLGTGFLRFLLQFCALISIFNTFQSFSVFAKPLNGPIGTLNDAFRTQDKICSLDHIDGQGSYRHLVGTLAGLDVGVLGRSKKIYTGFKFHQVFSFGGLFEKAQPSIKMTYCNLGKIQWQTEQKNSPGLEWESPICVYTPASAPPVVRGNRFWQMFASKRKSKVQLQLSQKQRATDDLDNFHCFKIARREKYSHRNLSIHMPHKWIGGLFYCDLDNEAKKTVLDGMSDNLESQNLKNLAICKTSNSIPLEPLISDSYLKHWTEVSPKSKVPILRRISRTHMRKTVPFLHTPWVNPLSGNFSIQDRIALNNSFPIGQSFNLANHLNWPRVSKDANEQLLTDIDPEECYEGQNNGTGRSLIEDKIRKFENFLVRASQRGDMGS
ncbi:LAFA_0G21198g1_1 [Lachancea sp. 'fantastica']|nr:LAFA_0G21198g1_1 [Lachancea sp. 'fantastica']